MTASPTPTDAGAGMPGELIAKSAKNPEKHHADPAYCSGGDHSPDAGNMVSTCAQVGLPSEEAIARAMCGDLDPEEVIFLGSYKKRWQSLLSEARCALDLIRPSFEAKEREVGQHAEEDLAAEASLDLWRQRALSAEAKLAQAVEALEPFAKQADTHNEQFPDAMFIDDYERTPGKEWVSFAQITLGDLRRARSAARGETP